MRMTDLIAKKRDGLTLSTEEIQFMIQGYTEGSIPDYQMSAMCMAILLRGMDDREILDLTVAMFIPERFWISVPLPESRQTSTPPAVSETKQVLFCVRWLLPAARRLQKCLGAGSAIPAEPSTNWRAFPVSRLR